MNSTSRQEPGVAWAFWAACVLAAAGGLAPVLFGGGVGGHLSGVLLPFAVAAAAMAVNALFHQLGRLFTIVLYFVAATAMVYGVLGMLALKLTLMVAGSCDPAPAACPPGFDRPLSAGEDNGLNVVVVLAVLSILVGFFGLMMIYRRRPTLRQGWGARPAPAPAPATPEQVAPAASSASVRPAMPAQAVRTSEAGSQPKAEAVNDPKELAAPEELKELPAPLELEELPPPA